MPANIHQHLHPAAARPCTSAASLSRRSDASRFTICSNRLTDASLFVPILILEQIDSRVRHLMHHRPLLPLSLSSVSLASARFLRFFFLAVRLINLLPMHRLFVPRPNGSHEMPIWAVQTHTYTSDGRHKSNGYACRDVHTIAVTCGASSFMAILGGTRRNKRRETACVNVALFKNKQRLETGHIRRVGW